MTRLSLSETTTDAGGRQLLRLNTRGGRALAAARISTGDLVGVRAHGGGGGSSSVSGGSADVGGHVALVEGVVTALEDTAVSVSVEDATTDDDPSALYMVLKLTSDVTYRRAVAGLEELERAACDTTHVAYALVDVLLRGRVPRFVEGEKGDLPEEIKGLNEKQAEAVRRALRAKDVAVVHGPPGTGKTHTVVAYVEAEVERGNRVLVVAPSNVAVDNIAERLAKSERRLKFVRAGHPARIIPSVMKHSMQVMVAKTAEAALVRDIRSELDGLEGHIGKTKERGKRKQMRLEQRHLRKELRKRENHSVRRLLAGMDVVLSTISGAGSRVLDIAEHATAFDVVVIDEAAQALEAACWVPLLRAPKVVLAGDPYQLAGTVKSSVAEDRGLKKSILDRVFSTPSLHSAVTMLQTQYRMHHLISDWSSGEFYEGNLVAHSSVASHRVLDLEACCDDADDDQNLVNPFILIDTAGGDCEEEDVSDETIQDPSLSSSSAAVASRSNRGEAEIVVHVINEFLKCGITRADIAVISPYSAQVELLRQHLWPQHGRALEVATIDSFQGREKEVVCLSLVRSNEQGSVGFLSDDRRMNVAITRARRCVVVVCDSETVASHPLLSRMIDYAENFGHYRSAVVDFPEVVGTFSNLRRPKEAIDAEKKVQRAAVKKHGRRVDKGKRRGSRVDISKPWSRPESTRVEMVMDDDVAARILREMQTFLDDKSATRKIFPKDLSSFERRVVHEVAEKHSLGHETTEVAGARQINVWKVTSTIRERESSASDVPLAAGHEKAQTDDETAGRFALLEDSGGEEKASSAHEAVDMSNDEQSESSGAIPNEEYKSINCLLRDVSNAREARKVAERQPATNEARAENTSARTSKKSRKKFRRGKHEDSDDDFDAVIAKYGADQSSTKAGSSSGPVQQIINGRLSTGVTAPNTNRHAKQRLAAKLSEEAAKRSKKSKK